MRVLKIELLSSWVLEHRDDKVLPIDFLMDYVDDEFDEQLGYVFSTLTEIAFRVLVEDLDENEIETQIKKHFYKKYKLKPDDEILTVRYEDVVNNSSNQDQSQPYVEQNQNAQNDVLNKINSLVACEEFKSLASEIKQISTEIFKNNTFDIFSYQTYIFSINDGYGLSTYLELLAELLGSLNIKHMRNGDAVIEEKLPSPKGDSLEPFAEVQRILRQGRKGYTQLLCIDISEWINELDGRIFKEFLIDLERRMQDFIIVFRVPFVDKEVLEGLRYSLNDLMFVRTISFPPFTKQETQKFAKEEFDRYGFNLTPSAWEGFHERIAEEKSDGKFYGLNTIKKVVRELLYYKQLSSARKGKSDLTITKKDTFAICSSSFNNGISGYDMLDRLVGGKILKERINEIIAQIELTRKNANLKAPCVHMRFVGNPGTGKTTVARIVGKILKEKGVLRIGNFYEYSGRDFCGRYIGETAPKTASMCRDAYGSVLFIDEAYSLYRGDGNDRDFGKEAIDTLIAEMENHRSDLVVIMAGYTEDMEKLMQGNAGLASRMPYVIEFPNFTREELFDIFVSMMSKQFKCDEDLLPAVKEYFTNIPDELLNAKEFSNARFVRNLFERTWAKASMRCQLSKTSEIVLKKADFERATCDKEFTFIMKKKNRIGF